MSYALEKPGTLTTLFLYQLRQRMHGSAPRSLSDLYQVDVGHWAGTSTGLKELRDRREVALLGKALSLLNRRKDKEAADLMVQRVREVLYAKRAGSSWEKAELISLLPSASASSTALPDGALAL